MQVHFFFLLVLEQRRDVSYCVRHGRADGQAALCLAEKIELRPRVKTSLAAHLMYLFLSPFCLSYRVHYGSEQRDSRVSQRNRPHVAFRVDKGHRDVRIDSRRAGILRRAFKGSWVGKYYARVFGAAVSKTASSSALPSLLLNCETSIAYMCRCQRITLDKISHRPEQRGLL